MLNILYFGSFDLPYDTERYITQTLESMGHKITRKVPANLSQEELTYLLSLKWDCILVSKGWFNFPIHIVNKLFEETDNLKIGWFWDLGWGTPREALIHTHHLFKADLVLTSDGGHREKWLNAGINHKTLRQGIYGPEAVRGQWEDRYSYDVVFVGSNVHDAAFGWKHRDLLLGFLQTTYGPRFKWIGKGQEIRNLELNNFYASAKVVVGDSVNSSNYWSNRLYETIGRGGFLVFPLVDGIEKEFTPYKHFVPYTFGDFESLKEIIDFYITHDKERNAIRDAGFEHCKANHTYEIRCKELVKHIHEQQILKSNK